MGIGNDTQLRRFLKQNYISFDIDNKCVYVGENVYDIDYDKYKDLDVLSRRKINYIKSDINYILIIRLMLFLL